MSRQVSEESLRKRLEREKQKVAILEKSIEDKTRNLYRANRELQRVHDQLNEIYRAIPSALFVFGADGLTRTVNNSAKRLLKQPEENLVGEDIVSHFANDSFSLEQLDNSVDEDACFRGEVMMVDSEGEEIDVLFSACPISGGGMYVGVAHDIRHRKHLEVSLRHAQKLEAVGQLAAGVAHEINTPMQYVGDSVSFVRESYEDLASLLELYRNTLKMDGQVPSQIAEKEEEADLEFLREEIPAALERSEKGIEEVSRIVRSMKDFSHPAGSEKALSDINRALESALTVCRNEYKYAADIETDFQKIPQVSCHLGELNQVFLNLIVNAAHAIEATERRGVIKISTAQDGDSVIISIADTGTGVPEKVRRRVFDPFFTTKDVGKGTGQGLAISRKVIVDGHGGELTFETEMGVGTTFHIRLPIAPVREEEPA